MLIPLSTGHVINTAHVAMVYPWHDNRRIQIKWACGHQDILAGSTEDDYKAILNGLNNEAGGTNEPERGTRPGAGRGRQPAPA